MAFTIKTRGDSAAPILADFRCEEHGVFEAIVARNDSEETACPTCGASSPWSPSPVLGRMQEVTAVSGRNDQKPHKYSMSTRSLGEGQSYSEWRKERKKVKEELRHQRVKEMLR